PVESAVELESEELLAAVTAAIARLPAAYRSTLNFRLVHGLQPTEIAHALGLSPSTVRSQLRRGLELLRRQLPRSLVLPTVLTASASDGLAAVRAHVLGALPRPTTAVVSSSSPAAIGMVGILLMKKSLLTVVFVLCAAAVLGVTWDMWMPSAGEMAAARPS